MFGTSIAEQPARICWRPQRLPVWHCSIHNHIATEIAAAVGLAPHGDLDAPETPSGTADPPSPPTSACPPCVAAGGRRERQLAAPRRRAYVHPGRHRRLFVRYTDTEYAAVAAVADRYGLTPTGFCSQAALDTARNAHTGATEPMEHKSLGNLQGELFQTRLAVNQLRAELHRTRSDSPAATDDLDKLITRAGDLVADPDDIVSRIHRRLGQ